MVDYGYLRDKRRGFIGGEVEDDETIDEALDREMVEELAEALHLPQLAIQSQILPQLSRTGSNRIHNSIILQAFQEKPGDQNIVRNMYEVSMVIIELSPSLFEILRDVLRPIGLENVDDLRPALATFINDYYLAEIE